MSYFKFKYEFEFWEIVVVAFAWNEFWGNLLRKWPLTLPFFVIYTNEVQNPSNRFIVLLKMRVEPPEKEIETELVVQTKTWLQPHLMTSLNESLQGKAAHHFVILLTTRFWLLQIYALHKNIWKLAKETDKGKDEDEEGA